MGAHEMIFIVPSILCSICILVVFKFTDKLGAVSRHEFIQGEPPEEPYGTVAVFKDISGNQWDLIQQTSVVT